MKFYKKIALAGAAVILSANVAVAESSITYYGGAKKGFDKKIAAAALKKAVAKIGDLRGSVEGLNNDYVATENELKDNRRTSLGFPTIQETTSVDQKNKPVPIV